MEREMHADSKLIQLLKTEGNERNLALKQLFLNHNYRSVVEQNVLKAGGQKKDSMVVFQDCIVILDKKVRRSEPIETSIEVFFQQTSKEIWSYMLMTKESMRNKILERLSGNFKLRQQIYALIKQNNGTIQDAEDCYQNGFLLLERQLRSGNYQGGSLTSYFYQTCFNLWRNELKKSKPFEINESEYESHASNENPYQQLIQKENAQILDQIFNKLSDTCRRILRLKYFVMDQLDMAEIAEKMGLKSAQTASNALSKCRKTLGDLINKQKIEDE